MPLDKSIETVLIIGSGPIIIGQACEFDYSGSQAARSLREEGIKVILINSNPATIMTDPMMADKVYLLPLTVESIEKILEETFMNDTFEGHENPARQQRMFQLLEQKMASSDPSSKQKHFTRILSFKRVAAAAAILFWPSGSRVKAKFWSESWALKKASSSAVAS